MRKYYALIFVFLFSLFSCEQEDNFPQVENTTSGKKWTLQIGSSPVEVYWVVLTNEIRN